MERIAPCPYMPSGRQQLISLPIIIPAITLMQSIYNYISETNHVSRVYSIAAVLYLQFVLHVMLFRP